MTEEEKAVLPPELLAAKERSWQRRLIAQLPIYYPGISGCRSVNEYNCDFKISEGAYGVVYRGTEKKTGRFAKFSLNFTDRITKL